MMDDDLANYLDAISQGDIYRTDAVLKETDSETTERVFLITANGSEQGPYIRKRIAAESGFGKAYERLWEAQKAGKRFMHLPHIFAYEDVNGYRDVVMEHVDGLTLEDVVAASDYSEQTAAVIAILICDAVMELHEGFAPSLIHRDLKPSNVIVSSANLTLVDFGISRTFDEGASSDTRSFGTRGYAPPEQFGYGQTDERSDVYALGMLIAFCFLREEPTRALLDSGFEDDRIPLTLRPVLKKATAFSPVDRYQSVSELKEDPQMIQMVTGIYDGGDGFAAPSVPPEPREEERVDLRRPHLPRAGIPRWLGTAWNAIVLSFWGLFALATIATIVDPPATDTFSSPVARVVSLVGVFVVGFGFIAYALLDKRGFWGKPAFVSRFSWWQIMLIGVAAGIVAIFAFAILGSTINSMSLSS